MAQDLEKMFHDLRVKNKSDMNITLSEQKERTTTKINENIDQKFNHVQQEIEKINQTNEDQEKRLTLKENKLGQEILSFLE